MSGSYVSWREGTINVSGGLEKEKLKKNEVLHLKMNEFIKQTLGKLRGENSGREDNKSNERDIRN